MIFLIVGAIMSVYAVKDGAAEVLISPFAYGSEVEMVDFCGGV